MATASLVCLIALSFLSTNAAFLDKRVKRQATSSPTYQNVTSDTGYLASPGYPNRYGKNIQYEVTVFLSRSGTVYLTLVDLYLERSRGNSCPYDYVTFNGNDDDRLCDKLSGQRKTIEADNGNFTLTFRTDGAISRRGFRIFYSLSEDDEVLSIPAPVSETRSGNSGFLISPNYPEHYPNNQLYEVTVQLEQSGEQTVYLNFYVFDLEDERHCSYDYVIVNEDEDYKWCGEMTGVQQQVEVENSFTVSFFTDGSDTAKGFNISYSLFPVAPLSETVSGNSGRLVSPGYPESYSSNLLYDYYVVLEQTGSQIVELRFDDFSVEDDGCDYDYVIINRNDDDRWCGDMTGEQRNVTAINGTFIFTFSTDDSVQERGFNISYSRVQDI